MLNIFGLSLPELEHLFKPYDLPNYRIKQIAEWLYKHNAENFSAMTNLPKDLRDNLQQEFMIARPNLVKKISSQDMQTTKFLLEMVDGAVIETVLMRHDYGMSVCVSSQVGCSMGCAFCASTLNGFTRNLTAGEMLGQVIVINELLHKENKKVDTIVIMGSGEPLLNYDHVLSFIRLSHEKYALGLGYRHFTLSTSGIVPAIYCLADEALPISLSLSLHAPNDELRSTLMPVNRKYPLASVIPAVQYYASKTKRRLTYEYILIAGVNDSISHADEIIELLLNTSQNKEKNREIASLTSINLIPLNPVIERNWCRPSDKQIARFQKRLERHLSVTVRREMGSDIAAACGQLRNRYLQEEEI